MSRVLVVEDDPDMRDMLVETLKQEGFDPVGTTDGDQAVAHLEEEPFDLLITDIVMPDRDGLETIIECTQRWPRMPIIAISGGGHIPSGQYLSVASKLGAHRTLSKPFVKKEFLRAVAELLENPPDPTIS